MCKRQYHSLRGRRRVGADGSMFPVLGRGRYVSVYRHGSFLDMRDERTGDEIRLVPYQPNHGVMVECWRDGRMCWRTHCSLDDFRRMGFGEMASVPSGATMRNATSTGRVSDVADFLEAHGDMRVEPHEFKPLRRFRNNGRCSTCLLHEIDHGQPLPSWPLARPGSDGRPPLPFTRHFPLRSWLADDQNDRDHERARPGEQR
jgi:hypothetical protein